MQSYAYWLWIVSELAVGRGMPSFTLSYYLTGYIKKRVKNS